MLSRDLARHCGVSEAIEAVDAISFCQKQSGEPFADHSNHDGNRRVRVAGLSCGTELRDY